MRGNHIMRAARRLLALAGAVIPLAACSAGETPGDAQQAAAAVVPSIVPTPVASLVEQGADTAPPRVMVHGVDLTGVGHDRGDPRAPIAIVEFSDFGCQYCAQYGRETFPAIEREFIATGKVFYKHVPFVMGMFPNGERAARAAECAGEQGGFWAMHDSVFARQRDWKRGDDPDGVLSGAARATVPDAARWSACYAADRQRVRTQAANAAARRLGVRATPTLFIDGQMVEGALPLDVMRKGLNAMLGQAGVR